MFLKISQKFTGKYLCLSLFFNKVTDLRPATLLKKRLWHRCFPVNFSKLLRTPILKDICERLLLPFKKWPLNHDRFQIKPLRKLEMLQAATFKSFLHQSYKSTQLLFLWQCFVIIFMRQTLTDYFWWLHKIRIARFL